MKLLKVGISHGDINGISYELLLKVLQDPELTEVCTPVIFGSAHVAKAVARQINVELPQFHIIHRAEEATDGHFNLVNVCHEAEPEVQFGQQTEAALQAEAQSLTAALDAYCHHHIDALITLPGHLSNNDGTHSLSDFIRRALDVQGESFDWVINDAARTLQLHHMDVSTQLGEGLASEAFQTHLTSISHNLLQDFGIMRPRLAVISPIAKLQNDLEELRELGINAFGPFNATTFLEGGWQLHYDGSIFLNDEEARAAILADDPAQQNIGYVSGLPIVLTYPLQGIGYEQAGQGLSDETSLRKAIYAAIDIERHRHSYYMATRHPLEKQWIPRGRDDFKLDLTKEE